MIGVGLKELVCIFDGLRYYRERQTINVYAIVWALGPLSDIRSPEICTGLPITPHPVVSTGFCFHWLCSGSWFCGIRKAVTGSIPLPKLPQLLQVQRSWVLLTVHPGTALGKWPTWCTVTLYNNTFIIIILYMFRATLCSSSGGQFVLLQHLV